MMNEKKNEKLTYAAALTFAIENGNLPDEIKAKLEALREQQMKRTTNRKPAKGHENDAALMETLLRVMTEEPHTVTEIMALDESLAGLNNQKVAALIRALVKDGKAIKVEDKRKSLFRLA